MRAAVWESLASAGFVSRAMAHFTYVAIYLTRVYAVCYIGYEF